MAEKLSSISQEDGARLLWLAEKWVEAEIEWCGGGKPLQDKVSRKAKEKLFGLIASMVQPEGE
jgi:hypothetical protein